MQTKKLSLVAILVVLGATAFLFQESLKEREHPRLPTTSPPVLQRPRPPAAVDAGASSAHDAGHDPEGIARRNPESMHGHQRHWPAACRVAREARQSPISIATEAFFEAPTSPLEVRFGPSEASLIDTGHTFQVRLTRTDDEVEFEGRRYRLAQFHFHKPAEHLVDGRQAPMEVHFVFLAPAGERADSRRAQALVLGFPVEEGTEHRELAQVWAHLPPMREGYGEDLTPAVAWERALETSELDLEDQHHAETVLRSGIAIRLSEIIPRQTDLYVYEGSLTTPPCDERITHAFASTPIFMSHEQMEHFEGYYEGNNRDIQPTGAPERRAFRRARLTARPAP